MGFNHKTLTNLLTIIFTNLLGNAEMNLIFVLSKQLSIDAKNKNMTNFKAPYKGTTENPKSMFPILVDGKETVIVIADAYEQETEKAFLVNCMNATGCDNKNFWLPKSLVKFVEGGVELPSWFYAKTFSSLR